MDILTREEIGYGPAARTSSSPFLDRSHWADVDARSAEAAVAADLPFIMFETNTASCGGFQGVSNVFASALWGLDYGLQMVYSNLTHALIHVGGQDVYYNVSNPCRSYHETALLTRSIALHS